MPEAGAGEAVSEMLDRRAFLRASLAVAAMIVRASSLMKVRATFPLIGQREFRVGHRVFGALNYSDGEVSWYYPRKPSDMALAFVRPDDSGADAEMHNALITAARQSLANVGDVGWHDIYPSLPADWTPHGRIPT